MRETDLRRSPAQRRSYVLKAPHTMPGHCRPPDHERKHQLDVRDNGHSPLVSYRPCITYSFIPFSLPRPLNSLSPCIYSILRLANCLVRYSGPASITPTQAQLRRSYRLSKDHHDAATRIPSSIDSQELSLWINPFNEIASIRSSQLFPSGRRQTPHIHTSPHRLRPAVWLFRHLNLAVTSFPMLFVSSRTYTTQWPQSLPVKRTIIISGLSLRTAYIIRRAYPSSARRHGLPQCHTYGCTHHWLGSCKFWLYEADDGSWHLSSFVMLSQPISNHWGWTPNSSEGPSLFSLGPRLWWRMGNVTIAHRSVIPECFALVGLVLISNVHRFIWGAYTLLLLQRKDGKPTYVCLVH